MDCAVVLCTYNRLRLLQECVASVRRSLGGLSGRIFVVNGGSTDGTHRWLREQECLEHDLVPVFGDLSGAVANYNYGFDIALGCRPEFVCVINDDDAFVGPEPEIERAVTFMRDPENARTGGVAFEFDWRGKFEVMQWRGVPYVAKGVIRTDAGCAAARAQGDPTGRQWWNPLYHSYAADTEQGLWIWRLGYIIRAGVGLRVHDHQADDELRRRNQERYNGGEGGMAEFMKRWGSKGMTPGEYSAVDAMRFGGLKR